MTHMSRASHVQGLLIVSQLDISRMMHISTATQYVQICHVYPVLCKWLSHPCPQTHQPILVRCRSLGGKWIMLERKDILIFQKLIPTSAWERGM